MPRVSETSTRWSTAPWSTAVTSTCHLGDTIVAWWYQRGARWSKQRVQLPEGHIADSWKYFGIPLVNGNHEEAARKSATAKYLRGVKQVLKSQLRSEQDPSHQHLCPANHQIPCRYDNTAKEGDRSRRYEDKEAPHLARRVSTQVQHPEAVH